MIGLFFFIFKEIKIVFCYLFLLIFLHKNGIIFLSKKRSDNMKITFNIKKNENELEKDVSYTALNFE